MSQFALYGKITAVPGQRDALLALLSQAAHAMEAVPGCKLYIVNKDAEHDDVIWVTELWDSVEDHASSLVGEAAQELIALARSLIGGRVEQIRLEPVAGKGL